MFGEKSSFLFQTSFFFFLFHSKKCNFVVNDESPRNFLCIVTVLKNKAIGQSSRGLKEILSLARNLFQITSIKYILMKQKLVFNF